MTIAPRLLFICNQAAYFRRHWLARAEAAAQAGLDVTVALPEAAVLESARVALVAFPLDRHSLSPWSNIRSLRCLARVIREVRPNIVHAATVKPNVLAGLATSWPQRIPCILSVTGLGTVFWAQRRRYRLARWVVRSAYRMLSRRADLVVTVDNRDDAALLAAQGVGRRVPVEITAGAGVDPEEFDVGPEPPAPPLRVVLPARMVWSKGIGVFVEAARRLRETGAPVEMTLVGGTDDASSDGVPRQTLAQWHADGAVRWSGFRADMRAVLREANVVCLPALFGEGLPRTLTEGALAARSLVATDVPGCREIVRHEDTGLRVPPGDAGALAAAIDRLAADPALRHRLAQRARTLALARFTDAVVIDRTLAIYERLLVLPSGTLRAVRERKGAA